MRFACFVEVLLRFALAVEALLRFAVAVEVCCGSVEVGGGRLP